MPSSLRALAAAESGSSMRGGDLPGRRGGEHGGVVHEDGQIRPDVALALEWPLVRLYEQAGDLRQLSESAEMHREAFIATADATWWVSAVDEACTKHEPGGYPRMRDADDRGVVVAGLRYLRDRHSHLVPVSLVRDVTSFFPVSRTGEQAGSVDLGVVYITPGYVWRQRDEMSPPDKDRQSSRLDDVYDRHVAGHKVWGSLSRTAAWFEADSAIGGSVMWHAARATQEAAGLSIDRRNPE